MAKRRGDGEGSIYQAKDGRWRGEVSIGYKPDGKPLRKIMYGKTRGEVVSDLKKALREQQLGMNIRPDRQTLSAFLDAWLSGVVALKNRPQTMRSYGWIVGSHLKPGLGTLALDKLTPAHVQAFLAQRHDSGLSPTTIKHIRATLRAALSHAERQGAVHRNVAKLVVVPRTVRYEATVLTPEQAGQFLAHLSGHKHEALYVCAITLGLRRGELLGLRWTDVDFETAYVDVRYALHRVKGAGLQLAEPKSGRAKRKLRIPQVCLAALARWRGKQAEAKRWAGQDWKEGNFIFTGGTGMPLHPDDISRELPAILKEAGLPKARMHDLRHSCATLLLSMGVSAKMVQETLGHSSYQLTMDTYSHVIPALRNEVADRMDSVFCPTPTKSPTNDVASKEKGLIQ